MATCLDIITYAMRLGRVIPSGETPASDESVDGLVALQSFYDQLVSDGMFGRLEDVTLDEDADVEEGKRYYVPAGFALTENATVEVDGVNRQPRDLAIYESLTEAGSRVVKVYDRTGWTAMTGLAQSDDAPFAGRGAMGLAAALATSAAFLAVFNDADISPRVDRMARQFMRSLAYKMGSTQDSAAAVYY